MFKQRITHRYAVHQVELQRAGACLADNGYGDYSVPDVHRLRFLKRSRGLGFSVEECRQLLSLYSDRERESADVKRIAETKLGEIECKIAALSLRTSNEFPQAGTCTHLGERVSFSQGS